MPEQAPFGMFLCSSGKQWLVKNTFGNLEGGTVQPGWEVVEIEGQKVGKWIEQHTAKLRDLYSYSTDQHALYSACTHGLVGDVGARVEVEFKTDERKKKSRTLTLEPTKLSVRPGPAVFPEGTVYLDQASYAELEGELGYVHFKRCRENLVEELDTVLAALEGCRGLVIDFRGNGGGGHYDELMERLIPKGGEIAFGKTYRSSGAHPFGGPVVAIVDAGTVSSAETMSGMLKEDGRAYLIGDSPTAGMSSSKTTIDLPSGLFQLYVSVASNKGRFNEGRGLEGIGVMPHEIVPYEQADLIDGIDTLTKRAAELLEEHPDGKFPKGVVPYVPKDS